MAFILSIFLFALQITFYCNEAMPTDSGDGVIKMPEDCKNQAYCTSDTDYPQAAVDYVLSDKDLLSFEKAGPGDDYNITTTLGTRSGNTSIDDINEIHPCQSVRHNKELRYLTDEQNNVRVVVQAKGRFMQYVPITSCKSPKPEIDYNKVMFDLVDKYNNIQCEEVKLNFAFVVLSRDMKSLELARVRGGGVPVACHCLYVE